MLLIFFAIPIVLSIIAFFLATPHYKATAKVMVASEAHTSSRDELQSSSPSSASAPQTTQQEVINSELEILNSRDLEDAAINHFGTGFLFPKKKLTLDDGTTDWTNARLAFDNALTAKPVKNSDVVEITYEASTPVAAQDVLAWYLDQYQRKHIEAFSAPMAAFLGTELKGLDDHLRQTEEEIAAYKNKNGIFDADEERKQILDGRGSLVAAAAQVRSHAAELRARVDELKTARAKMPETMQLYSESEQSDALTKAQSELLDLRVHEQELRQRYTDDSVPSQTLQGQIQAVEHFLKTEGARFVGRVRTGRNPLYDEMSAEIARAEIQLDPELVRAAALESEIAKLDDQLRNIETGQVQIDAFERDRDATADSIKVYREREQQARLMEEFDRQKIVSVRQIESANASTEPSSPKLLIFLAIGIAAGFFSVGAATGGIFAMRNTYIVPEAVESALDIPVFVSLPLRRA